MKNEAVAASRIISEVMHFFYHHGMYDLRITTSLKEDKFCFSFYTDAVDNEKLIAEYVEKLRKPRVPEIEGLYESLLGSYEGFEQVSILASMVDEVAYVRVNDEIMILICRNLRL